MHALSESHNFYFHHAWLEWLTRVVVRTSVSTTTMTAHNLKHARLVSFQSRNSTGSPKLFTTGPVCGIPGGGAVNFPKASLDGNGWSVLWRYFAGPRMDVFGGGAACTFVENVTASSARLTRRSA